ncbi:ammonium transporter [Campylobacter jejuni]|nr:ammonium transporter [Campylobacter jejuni]
MNAINSSFIVLCTLLVLLMTPAVGGKIKFPFGKIKLP